MRQIRQLSEMLDSMPGWAQVLLAIGLVAYSFVAIYGRINTEFGAKAFSKIPEDEVRTNIGHILQYTVIPVIVTVVYLLMLWTKYS